ncbi:LicD family protein [Exiguobacterium sp. R-17]|uniref:LicD family protein n=1 Tax=Exiguobacterium sp. R-17 TaxID=3404054 RepID=UPI003CFBC323
MEKIDSSNEDSLKLIQSIQLDMLIKFHLFCESNNLSYYLTGGTLLGSIRHEGFIPWDDDIDIGMPRKDYDKMTQLLSSSPFEDMFLQNLDSDIYFGLPISKLRKKDTFFPEEVNKGIQAHQGIFIDIFPWDFVPQNKLKMIVQKLSLKPLKRLLLVKMKYKVKKSHNPLKIFPNLLLRILSLTINRNAIIYALNTIITVGNKNPSEYMICTGGVYTYDQEKIKCEWIHNEKKSKFEEHFFPIIGNSSEYLTQIYGEYMKIPKKHQRKRHISQEENLIVSQDNQELR